MVHLAAFKIGHQRPRHNARPAGARNRPANDQHRAIPRRTTYGIANLKDQNRGQNRAFQIKISVALAPRDQKSVFSEEESASVPADLVEISEFASYSGMTVAMRWSRGRRRRC